MLLGETEDGQLHFLDKSQHSSQDGLAELSMIDLSPGALVVGDVVRGVVGVEFLGDREGKRGPYWMPKLRNATGTVGGKAWSSLAAQMMRIKEASVVEIEAKVCPEYGNEQFGVELEILSIRPLDVNGRGMDFWGLCNPRYSGKLSDLSAELDGFIAGFRTPVKALVDAVLSFVGMDAFLDAPGAPGIGHHGYIHGLVEHSLEVAHGVKAMCNLRRYKGRADKDFAVAAALLHDIGKVQEYAWQDGPIRRGTAGRFSSHTTLGARIVVLAAAKYADQLATAGCDDALIAHLAHVCESHHEKAEYGSPVPPSSLEAVMVSVCDKASADVAGIDDAISQDMTEGTDGFSQGKVLFHKRGVYHTPSPVPSVASESDFDM